MGQCRKMYRLTSVIAMGTACKNKSPGVKAFQRTGFTAKQATVGVKIVMLYRYFYLAVDKYFPQLVVLFF